MVEEKQKKTLAFDKEVIKQGEELAKKQNRSFNNWLEWIIMKEIERQAEQKE